MRQASKGLNGFEVGCSPLRGVFVALILVSLCSRSPAIAPRAFQEQTVECLPSGDRDQSAAHHASESKSLRRCVDWTPRLPDGTCFVECRASWQVKSIGARNRLPRRR